MEKRIFFEAMIGVLLGMALLPWASKLSGGIVS